MVNYTHMLKYGKLCSYMVKCAQIYLNVFTNVETHPNMFKYTHMCTNMPNMFKYSHICIYMLKYG